MIIIVLFNSTCEKLKIKFLDERKRVHFKHGQNFATR